MNHKLDFLCAKKRASSMLRQVERYRSIDVGKDVDLDIIFDVLTEH
jgi:hypothetical protein